MAVNDNQINICSRALNRLGCGSITSLEEGTTEAQVASSLYQDTKQGLLSAYYWSFAQADEELARLAETCKTGFKYLYNKPEDYLRAITLKENDRSVVYRFRRGFINTDAEKPVLLYIYDVNEADMPPYFINLLIDYLVRDFCIPLTEKKDDRQFYEQICATNFAAAKSADALSQSSKKIKTFSLIGVR